MSQPIRSLVIVVLSWMSVFVCCDFTAPVEAKMPPKRVYLTFDDGPSERYTPVILDILKREHVKATFFVVGYRCKLYPNIVRRIRREGHELGNHGYYHRFIADRTALLKDITDTDREVVKACGVRPIYYRPPGGMLSQDEWPQLQRLGHPVRLWTVDSQDWKANSTSVIVTNVRQGLRPGAIILLHDGVSNSRWTVNALPEIIRYCRAQGYSFSLL